VKTLAAAVLLSLVACKAKPSDRKVRIAAASDLQKAFTELARDFERAAREADRARRAVLSVRSGE
jgi:ABC-type molybdate transport system substrate-binding protein